MFPWFPDRFIAYGFQENQAGKYKNVVCYSLGCNIYSCKRKPGKQMISLKCFNRDELKNPLWQLE